MADTLWRLAWALPAVLVLAVLAVLAMHRLAGKREPARNRQRLRSIESLRLSDSTRLHLVELDRRPVLVVESNGHATQLQVPGPATVGERPATRRGSSWLDRLIGGAAP